MASSILLKRHSSINLHLPPYSSILYFQQTRSMGGGKRTFPGGLNKHQWRRVHEKRALIKERFLINQEKQLYQARIRYQIRAGISGTSSDSGQAPMSPADHIKLLADRFVRDGAEDLWTDRDGPIRNESKKEEPRKPRAVSPRNSVPRPNLSLDCGVRSENYSSCSSSSSSSTRSFPEKFGGDYGIKSRNYSSSSSRSFLKCGGDYGIRSRSFCSGSPTFHGDLAEKKEEGSESSKLGKKDVKELVRRYGKEEDGSSKIDLEFRAPLVKKRQYGFGRIEDDDDDDDSDDEKGSVRSRKSGLRMTGSSAALRNYDLKEEPQPDSYKIEMIRREVNRMRFLYEEEDVYVYGGESNVSQKRFDELGISPLTVKALSSAGYFQMTQGQEAVLSVALDGKDAVVKAKSENEKITAFLIPAIETVLKAMSSNLGRRYHVPPVFVLIICPTREIATQITAQANALLRFHKGVGAQKLVGGQRYKDDLKSLESSPSQIIVATPGRMFDHIESKSPMSARLMGLNLLIIDEANYLLDLDCQNELVKITDCLPRQRQTLFFSETVPLEVCQISQLILKKEHEYVDTIGLRSVETVSQVKQSYLVSPQELHYQIVYHLLRDHISQTMDYKVIIFCPTMKLTRLMYDLLEKMGMNVMEMDIRKSQSYCSQVSEEFQISKRMILVCSDISSHGINYPDVTFVIQVGIPGSREIYIDRLGRTGRVGKDGGGMLLMAPFEEYFLENLKGIPIEKYELQRMDPNAKLELNDCMKDIDERIRKSAYFSWLGHYNKIKETGRDKTSLVEAAKVFSDTVGLKKPPEMLRITAEALGLIGVPGIKVMTP